MHENMHRNTDLVQSGNLINPGMPCDLENHAGMPQNGPDWLDCKQEHVARVGTYLLHSCTNLPMKM